MCWQTTCYRFYGFFVLLHGQQKKNYCVSFIRYMVHKDAVSAPSVFNQQQNCSARLSISDAKECLKFSIIVGSSFSYLYIIVH